MRRFASVALILALVAIGGTARAGAVQVENARVRATPGGASTAAAYMVLRNTGRAPDRLTGAACACAAQVTAHETTTENGIARMRMAEAVAIPAHAATVFEPAGRLHLMLTGLTRPIRAGETVTIRLRFARAGSMTVPFRAVADPEAALTNGRAP